MIVIVWFPTEKTYQITKESQGHNGFYLLKVCLVANEWKKKVNELLRIEIDGWGHNGDNRDRKADPRRFSHEYYFYWADENIFVTVFVRSPAKHVKFIISHFLLAAFFSSRLTNWETWLSIF